MQHVLKGFKGGEEEEKRRAKTPRGFLMSWIRF